MQNIASTVALDKPEVGPLALQEQERIITMSYTLASEASLKSKLVAGRSFTQSPLVPRAPELFNIYAFSTEMPE